MKPSEVFREARTLLFECGWAQGRYLQSDGSMCIRYAVAAANGRGCGLGFKMTPELDAFLAQAVDDECGVLPGLVFNETAGRTFDEIVEALDRAEKFAEQAESA